LILLSSVTAAALSAIVAAPTAALEVPKLRFASADVMFTSKVATVAVPAAATAAVIAASVPVTGLATAEAAVVVSTARISKRAVRISFAVIVVTLAAAAPSRATPAVAVPDHEIEVSADATPAARTRDVVVRTRAAFQQS